MDRLKDVRAGTSPVMNMARVLDKLGPGLIVPEVNKYYTYVYTAKTKNIRYDQHPFIICTGIYKWGFTGFNYHWDEPRRYTWQEVQSNIFEVHEDEVDTMKEIPTALFKRT